MVHDVIIVGSGPAGLTAGIYTGRSKLKPLVIDGPLPGGQLMTTTSVENWPGMVSVMGPDLMIDMRNQAEKCGATFVSGSVVRADFSAKPYKLFLDNGQGLLTQSVIVATGAVHRRLGCPGEQEYWGKGVAVCATCDAPFYQDKEVIIVGGGNTAVTEAEHISHFAKKVTLVHILDHLTATDPIKEKLLSYQHVSCLYDATVTKIVGNGKHVTGVVVQNQKDKSETTVKTDGVFVAIGLKPNTDMFKDSIDIDKYGYVVVKNHTKTSVDGIFAAGDVSDYQYRQAITSAGVGCMAALDVVAYLSGKK